MATMSGKWKFKDNITFEYENKTFSYLNFTSNAQSFTNMTFLRTEIDSSYSYSVMYSKTESGTESITSAVWARNGNQWTEAYQTVDFGTEEQELTDDSFRTFMEAIADEVSEEPEDPVDPDDPEDPEDPVVPEETYSISGVYSFGESASCATVDQYVNFTYNGKQYYGVNSGLDENGNPVTYFEGTEGSSLLVQCMGVWAIDTTLPIDFGEISQTVSYEFKQWLDYSLVVQESTTISGEWLFRDLIVLDVSSYSIDIPFTSNGKEFHSMNFTRTDVNFAYSYAVEYVEYDEEGNMVSCANVYDGTDSTGSWVEAYQMVNFGEAKEVPVGFRTLMKKIAIEMEAVQQSDRGFKNKSSFICPILDPITFIDDKLRPFVKFYVRLSDVSEEVIE